MPATVKTPPTMAHSPVRKVERERRPSVTWGGGGKEVTWSVHTGKEEPSPCRGALEPPCCRRGHRSRPP